MRTTRQTCIRNPLIGNCSLRLIAWCAMVPFSAGIAFSQNSGPSGGALRIDKAVEPTAINQPPDATTQMKLHQDRNRQQNFDSANALRQNQIVDETMELLILARDLKSRMDKTGGQALPADVLREAEVIEILARDVQQRMILVVGPG